SRSRASYGSVSMAGSMTAASRVLREAITYDAHPHRSFRTCLKYMIALSGGTRAGGHRPSMEARRRSPVPLPARLSHRLPSTRFRRLVEGEYALQDVQRLVAGDRRVLQARGGTHGCSQERQVAPLSLGILEPLDLRRLRLLAAVPLQGQLLDRR